MSDREMGRVGEKIKVCAMCGRRENETGRSE